MSKKENVTGFVGGLVCWGIGYYDADWRLFWLIAGDLLILWSVVTTIRSTSKR